MAWHEEIGMRILSSTTGARLRCGPRRGSVQKGGRVTNLRILTVVCQGWCVRGLLETHKQNFLKQTAAWRRMQEEGSVCGELK